MSMSRAPRQTAASFRVAATSTAGNRHQNKREGRLPDQDTAQDGPGRPDKQTSSAWLPGEGGLSEMGRGGLQVNLDTLACCRRHPASAMGNAGEAVPTVCCTRARLYLYPTI